MENLEKFKNLGEILSKAQQKKILGGYGECSNGEAPCFCDGNFCACVSSVNQCNNRCSNPRLYCDV